jgi:ATP-dependent 26S proteasome regulatory subunit
MKCQVHWERALRVSDGAACDRLLKMAADFDLERAARMTAGFSGAELANAMNEAA